MRGMERKSMKRNKKIGILLAGMIACLSVMVPRIPVWAAGLSLSGAPSSVNIGDTFSVNVTLPANIWATVTVSYDASLLSYVSASKDVGGGSGSVYYVDYTSEADSVRITFRALSAGSASISASAGDAEYDAGGAASVGGASASVTVANAAGGGGNSGGTGNGGGSNGGSGEGNNSGGGTGTGTAKSGDNSLASLTLSNGTLSPAFAYNTTNYTAEVDYDVTSIAISAVPGNAKATVESVTGNENLSVGENTIKIVVRAENGVAAVYTITVTRKSEAESGEDPSENAPEEPAEFEVNGQKLFPAEEIPEEAYPSEDFSLSTIQLGGKSYPCLSFAHNELFLLYLKDEAESGALYVYDKKQDAVYPYVCLHTDRGYVIVLLPEADLIPEGYEETSLTIEGKGLVTACRKKADAEGYELLYCMNQDGVRNWYQYDSEEGTYQRFVEPAGGEEDVTEDDTELQEQYDKQGKELQKLKTRALYLTGALIVLAAALLIAAFWAIFQKIRAGKKSGMGEDLDDETEGQEIPPFEVEDIFQEKPLPDETEDSEEEPDRKSLFAEESELKADIPGKEEPDRKTFFAEEPEPTEESASSDKEERSDETELLEKADQPEADTELGEEEPIRKTAFVREPDLEVLDFNDL